MMIVSAAEIQGWTSTGFAPLRDALTEAAANEPGLQAQLAVYHRGRPVADLWTGGLMTGDTLLALFSTGKGAAFLVLALLVQDGVIELDRPVAEYWPDFAVAGKDRITVRQLAAHQAGLIGVPGGFTVDELSDDRRLAERLAGQEPWWAPGTAHGYHAFVIGALVGELVRRTTGQTLQEVFDARIRRPHDLDFHLGLPVAEEPRFLEAAPLTAAEWGATPRPPADSLTAIAFNLHAPEPTDLVAFGNDPVVHRRGPASSGSIGTARGVARMYAAATTGIDGGRPLLAPETIEEFTRPHGSGVDLVTGEAGHFLLGFEAQASRYPSLSPRAFGHSGAVGAQSFADPETGIAYSYARRRFAFGGGGGAPENRRLVSAVTRLAEVVDSPALAGR
jgi:CubicO group peptidase (beta-lactamase class C family)